LRDILHTLLVDNIQLFNIFIVYLFIRGLFFRRNYTYITKGHKTLSSLAAYTIIILQLFNFISNYKHAIGKYWNYIIYSMIPIVLIWIIYAIMVSIYNRKFMFDDTSITPKFDANTMRKKIIFLVVELTVAAMTTLYLYKIY